MSGYDADVLTDYLEAIRQRMKYRKGAFGHYYANREIDGKHELLYESIERFKQ